MFPAVSFLPSELPEKSGRSRIGRTHSRGQVAEGRGPGSNVLYLLTHWNCLYHLPTASFLCHARSGRHRHSFTTAGNRHGVNAHDLWRGPEIAERVGICHRRELRNQPARLKVIRHDNARRNGSCARRRRRPSGSGKMRSVSGRSFPDVPDRAGSLVRRPAIRGRRPAWHAARFDA